VPLTAELQALLREEPLDLARAALTIAKLEYPSLRPQPSLDELDRLGALAATRLSRVRGASVRARVEAINGLLYDGERFAGNLNHYDDYRNSFLNAVLERRLGIPITLALVYMEVARRAGMIVRGISFPGHFLMRVDDVTPDGDDLILDPFAGGAELDDADIRRLLARHLGSSDDDAVNAVDPAMLRPCTPRQMLARMLNNLKRTYVELRSFSQARSVAGLLLVVDPRLLSELRDRGLLSYHLDDFPAALRDLEEYLRLTGSADPEDEERQQLVEHVKTLRRRVAGMN
jgi:regulator of sirC expression with transglutaminase-like and TPR domain